MGRPTSAPQEALSTFPLKADICGAQAHVRLGSGPDIPRRGVTSAYPRKPTIQKIRAAREQPEGPSSVARCHKTRTQANHNSSAARVVAPAHSKTPWIL